MYRFPSGRENIPKQFFHRPDVLSECIIRTRFPVNLKRCFLRRELRARYTDKFRRAV